MSGVGTEQIDPLLPLDLVLLDQRADVPLITGKRRS